MRTPRTILRTFGVIAHVDAGKTTLSERLLFVTGRLHKMGEVHDGDAFFDSGAEERRRGITITAAATTCTWGDAVLQLVDTPGHVDFSVEVSRSLRVLDGAVVVLDAVAGVEPQTEAVWHAADAQNVPRLVFVNKLDRPGADLAASLGDLRGLGAVPALVQLPVEGTAALVDLIGMRLLSWPDPNDVRAVQVTEVPHDLREAADAARASLVEVLAEHDEVLLQLWLEGTAPSADQLCAALRRATLARRVVPVLCGAALRNIGIQPLLDAVVAYLPGPTDRDVVGHAPEDPAVEVRVDPVPDAPLAATAFKVVHADGTRLVWLRMWSGTLRPGDRVLVAGEGRIDRISRLVRLHGGRVESADSAQAGDIVAAVALAGVRTGETLCAPESPVLLAGLDVPEPVMGLAVEPATRADAGRFAAALAQLVDEDPSARVVHDDETGQLVLSGMGELHLQVLLGRLGEAGIGVRAGAPQVALRETVARSATVTHRLVQQRGGPGVFAVLSGELHPTGDQSLDGLVVEDRTSGGALPARFAAAAQAGARDAVATGLSGRPVVGLRLVITDARTHVQDSSEMAFRRAGRGLVLQALEEAGTVVLEPIMRVEVATTEEHIGAVSGLLAARRGVLTGVEPRTAGRAYVTAEVPLAELAEGFIATLRSATSGRAQPSMHLLGYRPTG